VFDAAAGVSYLAGRADGELLAGSRVRSSIDAAAVPRLVRGGVPSSRIPFLLIVFGLTLLLAVATFRLVRREQQLGRMRSDFIASVSHELRTPLTQIRMFAETLLLDRVRSSHEERRSLEIIDQEARRLSNLVENVLRLAQSERGRLPVSRETVDVGPLLRETAESFLPLARASGDTIEVHAGDGAIVHADPESLRQIVLNLLDNALKYGPRGQRIVLALTSDEDRVRVTVDDQGPGIPERDRDVIWQRYTRLDRDREGHKPGTGIGLAVVRELVAVHGGSVSVSDSPLGGAQFGVILPRSNAAEVRP